MLVLSLCQRAKFVILILFDSISSQAESIKETRIPLAVPSFSFQSPSLFWQKNYQYTSGPRQANLVLIAYVSSEGSGEPTHPHSLARTFAARSYKQ